MDRILLYKLILRLSRYNYRRYELANAEWRIVRGTNAEWLARNEMEFLSRQSTTYSMFLGRMGKVGYLTDNRG